MSKPPPPLRPLGIAIAVRDLRLFVPIAAVALLVLGAVPSLLYALTPRLPPPSEELTQDWTSDTSQPLRFAAMALGKLPPDDDRRQLRAPCDTDMYVEMDGRCWLPLALDPCPNKKGAFQHEGKCYARALKAQGIPTSGEQPRPLGVADP